MPGDNVLIFRKSRFLPFTEMQSHFKAISSSRVCLNYCVLVLVLLSYFWLISSEKVLSNCICNCNCILQISVLRPSKPSRSTSILRPICGNSQSPTTGHCHRPRPIPQAGVQVASQEKGPDENRVQAQSLPVHWRVSQVWYVSQIRMPVLLETAPLELLPPPHRHGLHLHGGLWKVPLLLSGFTQEDENLPRADDEEKDCHLDGLEVCLESYLLLG